MIIELRFTILVNFEDVVRKHDDFMFFLFLRCSDDLSKRHYYSETSIKRTPSGPSRKCQLNRGCPVNGGCKNCTLFVNDQHSMVNLY